MKWITRERPKIDRIACPWLIRRFIDPQAEFLYVPPGKVLDESLIPVEYLSEWAVAYPSLPSRHETGFRRGCCVLVGPPMIPVAQKSSYLRITRTI